MSGIMNMLVAAKTAISAAVDEFFNRTTLLLSGDGTNGAQNNTFLDSSTNNFTITRNGNTTQGTFSPFSQTGWSNYFSGSSDYLTSTGGSGIQLSTNNFTIEFWVYSTSPPTGTDYDTVVTFGNSASGAYGVELLPGTASTQFKIRFESYSTSYLTTSTDLNANTWYHIAVVRSSTSANGLKIYVNGVSDGTATCSESLSPSGTNIYIGTPVWNVGSRLMNGYVSNLRLLNGTAQYTSSFTPPTSPLTAITNTQLLTCQSNRFIDNSTNAFAITVNGSPSVQAFSPFAPTAAYSAATNGGSGYFDGSGDYLSVSNAAFNFSASDFTIEFWFYNAGTTGSDVMLFQWGSGAAGDIQFVINQGGTTGNIALGTSGQSKTPTSTTRYGWNHIAGVKSGTTYYTYVNGVRNTTQSGGSTSSSTSFNIASGVLGYISGLKISNTAVYTGTTLTIPTAPPSNDANTKLLLNFTNGGIIDATGKNVLETVGNAQISTTQSKWGGSSIYIPGTVGSYLISPSSQFYNLFGSDMTIEGWLYPTSGSLGTRSEHVLAFVVDGSNRVSLYFNGTTFTFWTSTSGGGGAARITSTAITVNTQSHFALVKQGSTFTLYVNGVSQGTSTTTVYPTSAMSLRIGTYDGAVGADTYTGYIDDLRFTRYARYTGNFTPPTQAFALQ